MTQKHDLNIENIKKKSIKWHLQSKSCFKMSHVENRCTDGGQIYPRANPLNQMHSLNRRCIWNQTDWSSHFKKPGPCLHIPFIVAGPSWWFHEYGQKCGLKKKKSALNVNSWLAESKHCWLLSIHVEAVGTYPAHRSKGALALGMEWLWGESWR